MLNNFIFFWQIRLTFGVALVVCLVEALPQRDDENDYEQEELDKLSLTDRRDFSRHIKHDEYDEHDDYDHHDHHGHYDLEYHYHHKEPHYDHHHIENHDHHHHENPYHHHHGHYHHEKKVIKRDTTLQTPSQEQIRGHHHGSPPIYSEEFLDPEFGVQSHTSRQSGDYQPYPLPPFLVKPSVEGVAQVQKEKPSKESIFSHFGHQHHSGPPPFYSKPEVILPVRVLKTTEVKKAFYRPSQSTTRNTSKRRNTFVPKETKPVVDENITVQPCKDAFLPQHGPIQPIPPSLCKTPQKPMKGESNHHLLGQDGHGIRNPVLQSASSGLDEPLHLPPMTLASAH